MPIALVELLYRTSLEKPGLWWMTFGTGLETDPPYLNIGMLSSFAYGYRAALAGTVQAEDDAFFAWLRDEANAFPGQGWARHFLSLASGDHEKAIRSFFAHVHGFALARRPEWFVRFNREPQPSRIQNGFGTPCSPDIRLPAHVEAATGRPPVSPPDVRIRGVEVTDGSTHLLGLPPGAATWWGGDGIRVAFVLEMKRHDQDSSAFRTVVGSLAPLSEVLFDRAGRVLAGCAIDLFNDRVHVVAHGETGAVLIRDGSWVGRTDAGTADITWPVRSGDQLVLASPSLMRQVRALPGPALPPSLASGEPLAWSQAVETSERRVAISVRWT